jgi:hypothetical protein
VNTIKVVVVMLLLLCSAAFGLTANYNGDCVVNFEDFAYLASEWNCSLCLTVTGGLNPDATGTYCESGSHHGSPVFTREDSAWHLYRLTEDPQPYIWVINPSISTTLTTTWGRSGNDYSGVYAPFVPGVTGNATAAVISVQYDLIEDGTINYLDLAEFATQWLEFEGGSAEANDVSFAIPRGQTAYFDFDASDTIIIDSLPEYGTLYDPNNSDPNYTDPNVNNSILIDSVPYTMVDTKAMHVADPCYYGITTFNYYSDNDPNPGFCGISGMATVTITCTIVPVAYPQNVSAYTYETYYIEFEAIGTIGGDLDYYIKSLPENGLLADPFVGTPVLDANLLPWRLQNNGNVVIFTTDTVGDSNFLFCAMDDANCSDDELVSITATAYPNDMLYVDNSPITIPDNNYFDINAPEWAISFYINNKWHIPYQDFASKLDANGVGWQIRILAGKIQFDAYDVNGLVASVRGGKMISDGDWYITNIIYRYDSDPNYGYFEIETLPGNPTYSGAFLNRSFNNDANLVINTSCGIDNLRFWDDVNDAIDKFILPFFDRNDATETVLGFGNASNVRYFIQDECAGTISDDKGIAPDGVYDPNYVYCHPDFGVFRSMVKF